MALATATQFSRPIRMLYFFAVHTPVMYVIAVRARKECKTAEAKKVGQYIKKISHLVETAKAARAARVSRAAKARAVKVVKARAVKADNPAKASDVCRKGLESRGSKPLELTKQTSNIILFVVSVRAELLSPRKRAVVN